MRIYIQSQIDLITNSSTEVFQIADNGSVEDLKEVINAILEVGESPFKCDDLFDIKLSFARKNYFLSDFIEESNSIPDNVKEVCYDWRNPNCDRVRNEILTQYSKELEEYTMNRMQACLDAEEGGFPNMIIEITPKSHAKEYSHILDKINYLFSNRALYC